LLAAVFPSEPGTELSKCDQILFGSGFGKKLKRNSLKQKSIVDIGAMSIRRLTK